MPSNASKAVTKGGKGPAGSAAQRSTSSGGKSSNRGTIASKMVNKGTKLPNGQGS